MTTHCNGCGKALYDEGSYCTCGAHFHDDCKEGHRDWCAREGRDPWVGAVEL